MSQIDWKWEKTPTTTPSYMVWKWIFLFWKWVLVESRNTSELLWKWIVPHEGAAEHSKSMKHTDEVFGIILCSLCGHFVSVHYITMIIIIKWHENSLLCHPIIERIIRRCIAWKSSSAATSSDKNGHSKGSIENHWMNSFVRHPLNMLYIYA